MTSDFIETRSARLKKNSKDNFVSVEYITHKKKVPVAKKETTDAKDNESSETNRDGNLDPRRQQELEMKKARYEVIKLGMSSLRNVAARKAKTATAIALGARPSRNHRTNYKKLKDERKKAKESAIKKERISGADKSLVKRKTRRQPRHKDNGILGVYGKVQKGPGRT